jgi:RsiW-degrading membrane proteinase PrsW (M82 family)
MDRFSYLRDRQPIFLLIGLALVIFAALCALTGEAPARYHGFAYRDEDPKRFWRRIVMYFLAGLFLLLVGLYLYLTSD